MGAELTVDSVGDLRARHQDAGIAPSLIKIDCARVERIDPVAALLLHRFVRDVEGQFGSRVSLTHLSVPLMQQLRHHPLSRYLGAGEELFEDPFASSVPSTR